jgi:hypothetical protein
VRIASPHTVVEGSVHKLYAPQVLVMNPGQPRARQRLVRQTQQWALHVVVASASRSGTCEKSGISCLAASTKR